MAEFLSRENRDKLLDLSEVELLARLIWGEARGESLQGKVAVGCVVWNRVNHATGRYGRTWRNVMLKPWAFSCFWQDLGKNPQFDQIISDKYFATLQGTFSEIERIRVIADMVRGGLTTDPTGKATHYHVADMQHPPYWADSDQMKATVMIGNHKFYEEL